MKISTLVKACLLLSIFTIISIGSAKAAANDVRFANGKTSATVSFEDDFGLIFLNVRVGDSKPLWFLLDTGFDTNVINADLVRSLNIELKNKQTVAQPGGAIEMGSAEGLNFKLDGLELSNQTANSAPISQLEPVVGRKLDGILGHDFLAQFVTEIDYAKKTLTFYAPQSFKYKGGGESFPVEVTNKEPFMKGFIVQPGRAPIEGKFKIDTGSIDVMGLNKNFLEGARVLTENQKVLSEPGVAVGGETKGVSFRVAALKFGKFRLENPVIGATLDSGGFENRADAGTIGAALLGRFKVILDYPHDRVIFEKNKNFAAPFTRDASGLRIITDAQDFRRFKIVKVLENSPAKEANVREGDEITEIDGVSANALTLAAIRNKLLAGNRKTVRLKLRRDDKEIGVSLKLRQMI